MKSRFKHPKLNLGDFFYRFKGIQSLNRFIIFILISALYHGKNGKSFNKISLNNIFLTREDKNWWISPGAYFFHAILQMWWKAVLIVKKIEEINLLQLSLHLKLFIYCFMLPMLMSVTKIIISMTNTKIHCKTCLVNGNVQ